MAKQVKLIQSLHEFHVSNTIVNKIYNMLHRFESHGETNIDPNTSNLIGEITLSGPTYAEYVSYINETYPNFIVNASEYYIMCNDPVVLQCLLDSGMSSDGIGLLQADFDAIKNLSSITNAIAEQKDYVIDLRILEKFTKATNSAQYGPGPFNNFTELKYAVVPKNFSNMNKNVYQHEGMFQGDTKLEYVRYDTTALTALDHWVFKGCSNPNLVVDMNNTNSSLYSITMSSFDGCQFKRLEDCLINYNFDCLESISNQAFANNDKLEYFKVYRNVRFIGNGVFENCTNLETFEVEENGVDIELRGGSTYGPLGGCFNNTPKLTFINWYKRVKKIAGRTGGVCGASTAIWIFTNDEVPTIEEPAAVFRHFKGTIYVKDEILEDWQAAVPNYASKIKGISEYVPSE